MNRKTINLMSLIKKTENPLFSVNVTPDEKLLHRTYGQMDESKLTHLLTKKQKILNSVRIFAEESKMVLDYIHKQKLNFRDKKVLDEAKITLASFHQKNQDYEEKIEDLRKKTKQAEKELDDSHYNLLKFALVNACTAYRVENPREFIAQGL